MRRVQRRVQLIQSVPTVKLNATTCRVAIKMQMRSFRLTWSSAGSGSVVGGVVAVAVDGRGRARHQTQRRHVRHVRGQRVERSGVVTGRSRRISARNQIRVGAVTGTPPLAPVAVDGRLQLRRRAEFFLLALVRVQVLHVPARKKIKKKKLNFKFYANFMQMSHQNGIATHTHSFSLNPIDIRMQMSHGPGPLPGVRSRRRERQPQDGRVRRQAKKPAKRAINN